jgi:hypothetical protein
MQKSLIVDDEKLSSVKGRRENCGLKVEKAEIE